MLSVLPSLCHPPGRQSTALWTKPSSVQLHMGLREISMSRIKREGFSRRLREFVCFEVAMLWLYTLNMFIQEALIKKSAPPNRDPNADTLCHSNLTYLGLNDFRRMWIITRSMWACGFQELCKSMFKGSWHWAQTPVFFFFLSFFCHWDCLWTVVLQRTFMCSILKCFQSSSTFTIFICRYL